MAEESDVPHLLDLPLGTGVTQGTRSEYDSLGHVEVPADRYWGAQTQRALEHFAIGEDRMPREVHHAYGIVKDACARANHDAGLLPAWARDAIVRAAEEVAAGHLDDHFPLYVWQAGSGTQTNMNVNEVIANRASQLLGGTLGSQQPISPNDHVNMSQSSNDTFPAAMHIASVTELEDRLLPRLRRLADVVADKADAWMGVVKIGRTHLQDAVPLTVGQEWSGYAAQLREAASEVERARDGLLPLALGGTAVGTGLNAPPGFSVASARYVADLTGRPYVTAPNKFAAQGSLDAMVRAHAALRGVAVALMKMANDLRWLGSGPRTGIGELLLPSNEPGSSIMPGKVNPTQCEAIVMIAIEVVGDDSAVAFAGSQGNFELNAMRPIIVRNVLHSARILGDGIERFVEHTVLGTELDRDRIADHVERSLMLVTALSPVIGYHAAAGLAQQAAAQGRTLREVALESGLVDAESYDDIVDPTRMVGDGLAGA